MVRLLIVADEIAESLFSQRLLSIKPDLVLGAGDLPWDYLEFIASMIDAPMLFVPGNHDPEVVRVRRSLTGMHLQAGMPVADPRPLGMTNVHGQVLDVAGLRIAGLGGCVRYRPGPNMYTQAEYVRLGKRLVRKAARLQRRNPRPIDILLTHAPPRGLGDGEDRPHHGIAALHDVIPALAPRWHLHGHIHPYGQRMPDRRLGETTLRNVIPYRVMEISPRHPVTENTHALR